MIILSQFKFSVCSVDLTNKICSLSTGLIIVLSVYLLVLFPESVISLWIFIVHLFSLPATFYFTRLQLYAYLLTTYIQNTTHVLSPGTIASVECDVRVYKTYSILIFLTVTLACIF